MIFSVRGNKSIKTVFDSQVVRLDVSAPRVVRLDVSAPRVVGLDVFWIFLRLCGQVGCWHKIGSLRGDKYDRRKK